MHIKMKIVEVNPDQHSIVMRYFSEKLTEDILAVHDGQGNVERREDGSPMRCRTDANVQILVVPAPTGQALLDYLFKRNPPNHEWFELQEKILDVVAGPPNKDIERMVGLVTDAPPKPVPQVTAPAGTIELRARRDAGRQIGTTIL